MTDTHVPLAAHAPTRAVNGWLNLAEHWLDQRGKGAWIAATVIGFIVFWPIGLGLLGYMIWSKRMPSPTCSAYNRSGSHRSSGNSAFDTYKADTLKRLETEQEAFEAFLQRLRAARDKAEFDQFMADRSRTTRDAPRTGDGVET